MEGLYGLIQCLSSSEWSGFSRLLTCLSDKRPDSVKQAKLANLLRYATSEPNDKELCLKLYNLKKHQNLFSLKNTVKEKILDFLLSEFSGDKHQDLDPADLAIIRIKKKSAQFQQLYYSKSRNNQLTTLLNEIIELGKKFEHHQSVVEHLRLRKEHIDWKKGIDSYNQTKAEMAYHERCYTLLNTAEHYYHLIGMEAEFSTSARSKRNLEEKITRYLTELKEANTDVKSSYLNYYINFIEYALVGLRGDYLHARSICLKILNIVRTDKAVYRKQRIGVVLDNLSRCEYLLGNHDQAIECAREARSHFTIGSENTAIALEQEFHALIAMRNFSAAKEISDQLVLSCNPKESGAFKWGKYHYLNANAKFLNKEFSKALELISKDHVFAKDKSGWEIGVRILKAQTQIELQMFDEAGLTIRNLKKFVIYSEKKDSPVRIRDKKIISFLLLLMRNSFRFNMLNGKADEYLKTLSSDKPEYKWEPFTHEVFPFHDWLKEKVKNIRSRQFAEVHAR